jgi:hypothetical protein
MTLPEGRIMRCLCLLLVLLAAGCYTFRPTTDVRSGADVRAELNVEAAVRRSQSLNEPIRHVDGRVIEFTPQALSLDVLVARSSSVFQDVEIRDTVRLMSSEIDGIYERQFSVWRTALVSIAVAGGAIAVVSGISSIVGGTDDEPDPGTPTIVVPVFSLGLRALRVFGISLRR